MPNTRLYKNLQVDGDIAPYRIVTLNAERLAEQATALEDVLIGTADELGKQPQGVVDVAMSDIPEVESGAPIASILPCSNQRTLEQISSILTRS